MMNYISIALAAAAFVAFSSCGRFSKKQELQVLPDSVESVSDESSFGDEGPVTEQNDQILRVRKVRMFQSRLIDNDFNDFLYSRNELDLDWPVKFSGCDNLAPLHAALQKELFGQTSESSIETSIEKELSVPLFARDGQQSSADAIEVKRVPDNNLTWQQNLKLRRVINTPSLACYESDYYEYNGGAVHGIYAKNFVLFSKKKSVVLDAAGAFGKRNISHVLYAVNKCIRQINQVENRSLEKADSLGTFYPSADSLVFVFQPYDIASYAEGIILVKVPYKMIQQYFTADFKEALAGRENFSFELKQ